MYVFPNGDRYEGESEVDLPAGYGVYRFAASGALAEGTWRDGRCHGWCLLTVGERRSYGVCPPWVPEQPCAGGCSPRASFVVRGCVCMHAAPVLLGYIPSLEAVLSHYVQGWTSTALFCAERPLRYSHCYDC